jgi:D-sedoheptulose 7-phosphate isomerase
VLLAFSTSGRSPNVINAVDAARAQGMRTIALTDSGGEHLARFANQALLAPSTDTARIAASSSAAAQPGAEFDGLSTKE